jgi:tRNA-dihydrouridine synthase
MSLSVPEPALRIGTRVIAPALVLAPMSGVTDSPFRRMVRAEPLAAGGRGSLPRAWHPE